MLLFVVILGFITYDSIAKALDVWWVFGGVILGVLIGIAASRMFLLKWHADTRKVIMSMDKLGFLVIGAYIVFRIFSKQLLGNFVHGEELTVTTFGLLAGIMLGRFLSLATNVRKILLREGII
jgi:site-specific recombinase